MSRFSYFSWAVQRCLRRAPDKTCPGCGSSDGRIVKRKYIVTSLRECSICRLRYRLPKDDPESTQKFYAEESYKQGFTTDLPSAVELQSMLESKFAGSEKDFSHRIDTLRGAGLRCGARILDFGCSWGYGSWQMREAGFEVLSYEIGRDRARYAHEYLQCTMVPRLDALAGTVDCFFSSHVIEHLPNPNIMFDIAVNVLRPGGLLVCYCPNGAPEREHSDPTAYHRNWGQVHPLMVGPDFLISEAERRGFVDCLATSSPVHARDASTAGGSLEGDELLVTALKPS